MKKQVYFISFVAQHKENNGMVYGCIEVIFENPITSVADIEKIIPILQDRNPEIYKVTPLYFQWLREE